MLTEKINLVKDNQRFKKQVSKPEERAEPSAADIEELFAERITPETDLPPMQPLFRMFDVPCFYRGELVADCGKAKSGKTFFLSILMAACLTQKALALERLSERALKVLWLDTEQSQQSTQEILKDRIIPLTELNLTEETAQPPEGDNQDSELNDSFFAFNLRGKGYEKRGKMVDTAIRTIKPDLCIIDGVKDLMTDINDAVQATLIMEKLMALAQELNCCIVCVLHQNKSEQDRNMRGSIGTELTNKAFEVFQCEIVNEKSIFKVTHTYSRKQKMKQKFLYRVNEQGLPEECADYQEQPRDENGRWKKVEESDTKDMPNLRDLFSKAMEGRTQRPFSEVMAVALKKCGVVDAKAYYAYLDMAIEQGIIRKEAHPETGVTWVELIDNSLPF